MAPCCAIGFKLILIGADALMGDVHTSRTSWQQPLKERCLECFHVHPCAGKNGPYSGSHGTWYLDTVLSNYFPHF